MLLSHAVAMLFLLLFVVAAVVCKVNTQLVGKELTSASKVITKNEGNNRYVTEKHSCIIKLILGIRSSITFLLA